MSSAMRVWPILGARRLFGVRGWAFSLALTLLAMSVLGGVPSGLLVGTSAQAAPVLTAPVVTGSGASGDGRITLNVVSSATGELPPNGATVTLTYTVTNTTSQNAYYRSLTDSVCSTPGYRPQSGMQTDGARW